MVQRYEHRSVFQRNILTLFMSYINLKDLDTVI
jgi:hypothetical protein